MRRRWLLLIAVLVLCLTVWIFAPVGLETVGAALVDSNTPRQADAILVLAGDWRGDRILKACDLLAKGFAPVVLVSGPADWYGLNEADAAIQFAGKHGCDTSRLNPLHLRAFSTLEEARVVEPVLRQRSVDDLIVVTSNYHTARAGRIFRRVMGQEVRLTMVASPDPFFEPDRWWKSREGQKTVFLETSKTVADWIGL